MKETLLFWAGRKGSMEQSGPYPNETLSKWGAGSPFYYGNLHFWALKERADFAQASDTRATTKLKYKEGPTLTNVGPIHL